METPLINLISFTTTTGCELWINPVHVISVYRSGNSTGISTVVNDEAYRVTDTIAAVINRLQGIVS